jgi:hypothetical protein
VLCRLTFRCSDGQDQLGAWESTWTNSRTLEQASMVEAQLTPTHYFEKNALRCFARRGRRRPSTVWQIPYDMPTDTEHRGFLIGT